jgi:hypothetical protein
MMTQDVVIDHIPILIIIAAVTTADMNRDLEAPAVKRADVMSFTRTLPDLFSMVPPNFTK